MNTLLSKITTATWLIDPSTAEGYFPIIHRMLQGEKVEMYPNTQDNSTKFAYPSQQKQNGGNELSNELVAIHYVSGVITMGDQDCGPRGTKSLMAALTDADNNPDVISHLIVANSGGGEATNIQTVFNHIRNLQKPTITHVQGLAASAMYFIASATDAIYAQQETDLVGSIGAMCSFTDMTEFYAKNGIKLISVYADKSTEKNKIFGDMSKGEYDGIKSVMLNPHQQIFEESVRLARPSADDDVYAGAIYTAKTAIEKGLIDGIRTEKEAIQMAYDLGLKKKKELNMNFEYLNSALNTELQSDKDGGVYLQAEQIQLVENLAKAHNPTVFAELQTTIDTLNATVEEKITALDESSEKVISLQQTIADMQAEIDDLKASDAEAAATAKKDDANEFGTEVNFWNEMDKKVGLK